MTIAATGASLRDGSITARALTERALNDIAERDGALHSFLAVTADCALAEAERADRMLAEGRDLGPLHGIPFAVKDVIDAEGMVTTAQSRVPDAAPAPRDATVTARLRAAGAVLLGKLATYEFATVGPDFGLPTPPARNPRNGAHITGGSSSGCAASVAAGFVPCAIGTDTGGSLRSPASYCGVVGLKPTYGRVSRRGVLPLSWSLDHVGAITATVADAALVLDAMAGHDGSDPASADVPPPHAAHAVRDGVAGLRIGFARGFHADAAAPEIAAALDAAAGALEQLGALVEEVALPAAQTFDDCGAVILHAEAYALHRERLRTHGQLYGRLAHQSLLCGAALSAADLLQAQRVRQALCRAVHVAMQPYDALLVANTLTTAPPFAAFDGRSPRWTPMRTFAFNLTGQPVLALPIGTARDGLPIGAQIVGQPFHEAMICRIGAALEEMVR